MPAGRRIRQFVQAAAAWVKLGTGGPERAIPDLPPAAVLLFRNMPRYDRAHALRVVQALQSSGYREPDVLVAGVLHDVGKTGDPSRRVRLWHRVAAVLVRRLNPRWLESLGQDRPGDWRQPFHVQQHHAAIGAQQAQQAGCPPLTVDLIRRHEDRIPPADDPRLAALQAADDAN